SLHSTSPPFLPYTTLFRSRPLTVRGRAEGRKPITASPRSIDGTPGEDPAGIFEDAVDPSISSPRVGRVARTPRGFVSIDCIWQRSEEHTSELQSLTNLVCR